MKSLSTAFNLALTALLFTASLHLAAAQPPEYSLFRLGLTGGVFMTATGVETSVALTIEGGIVAGTSTMTITTTTSGGGGGGGGLGGGGIIIIGGGGGPITQISLGQGQWLGNVATGVTTRVGLYSGPEFTRTDGVQDGTLLGFRDGYAAGQAIRYNGNDANGQASWIASAATGLTTRIGFFDAAYTFVDGSQDTHLQYVQGGYAAGYSSIAVGGSGYATWAASGATGVTTRVGLFGAGYTTDSGVRNSAVRGLNGGIVIGESDLYTGETSLGLAAWMANAATEVTTRLGYTGAAYTLPNNTQISRAQYVKDGYVAGYSVTSVYGSEQWVAPVATGTPVRVGLTSATFTSSTGVQYAYADLLSDGYIAGQSYIYNGGPSYAGHAAWVANAASGSTHRIGFFDTAPYIDSDGRQYSLTTHLTANYVAGYSRRYSGSQQIGQAVWVAPVAAGDAVRVGLFSAAYTSDTGAQNSAINFLKGQYAAGASNRFSGSTPLGVTAWVADAASGATTPLGLTDAAHTSGTGAQSSGITHLTATGYVAGYSLRFTGTAFNGQTPWIWDANTSTFDPIVFSIRPSDGFATATITQLYDNGLAIGQYELYDASSTDLGARAFAWTPKDGAFDLNDQVAGGLSAAGWSALATAGFADPVTGAIVGGGLVPANATTQAVFAAVPTPEPGSTALLAVGALGLLGRRRRK